MINAQSDHSPAEVLRPGIVWCEMTRTNEISIAQSNIQCRTFITCSSSIHPPANIALCCLSLQTLPQLGAKRAKRSANIRFDCSDSKPQARIRPVTNIFGIGHIQGFHNRSEVLSRHRCCRRRSFRGGREGGTTPPGSSHRWRQWHSEAALRHTRRQNPVAQG